MNKYDFNNIKIPDELDNFIEDTIEKADIKKRRNKKNKKIKYSSTIAAGLTVVILLLISNPAVASKIPFVGDIFKYLNKDVEKIYETYSEYSTEINMNKESNGIKITLKEAIFDGRVLNFTYMIESDKDLGFYPIIGANSIKEVMDSEGNALIYEDGRQERIEDNNYIGQATYKISEENINKEYNKFNFIINWKDIVILNDENAWFSKDIIEGKEVELHGDIKEVISGEWNFDIEVNTVENYIKEVNETIENNLYEFTVEKISISPVSFNINYNYITRDTEKINGKLYNLDIDVKDDLGNIYTSQPFGISGDGRQWWRNSVFEKINEDASELIITPRISELDCEQFSDDYTIEDMVLEPIVIKLTK